MDRVLSALFTDDKCSNELRFAYYLLSKETVHIEDKTTQSIVKNVKSLLLSSKTRYQGLIFLSNLLGQLSNDIFTDNCSVLIQPAIKVLQESKDVEERILAYKVLTQIFAKIYRLDSQNLTRELSNCITPLLTQCFTNLKSSDFYYASNWLCACATLFPSPVSAKRLFLESKLLEAVTTVVDEDGDVNTLKVLGFAYSKVMLAGNSNVQKYREFFSKLMNTFGQYFSLYSVFSIKKPSMVLQFENDQNIANFYKESSDIFIDPLKNARRLHFLTAAICALITGQYSGSIPLPVEGILECLNSFMLLSNGNIKDSHTVDVFAIGHVIPILYDNIFIILTALLTSCKQNFILFTRLVNRVVISTIEWLDKLNSIEKQLYLNLRCSLYTFLTLYFNVLGAKSCFSTAEQQLVIKHLLGNVKIHEPNITFTASNSIPKAFGSILTSANKELLVKSTLNAIRVISRLLSSMCTILDPSAYNLIQNEVVHTLLHIYRNWFNLAFPYKNEECRRELIELLKLLLQSAPSPLSPPLETAIVVLTQAYRVDKSPAVRYLIENGFHLVNFIMSSRISAFPVSASRPPAFFESQLSRSTLEPVLTNDDSLANVSYSLQADQDALQLVQQAAFSSMTGTNDDINSVTLSTLESTSTEQGTKRRSSNDVATSSKVAKAEEPTNLNADIIFEGIFENMTKPKPATSEHDLTDKLLPESKPHSDGNSEVLTTTISQIKTTAEPTPSEPWQMSKAPTQETSEDANDALSYFVE